MPYLHPIEPFLHLPSEAGALCLDQHSDADRRRHAHETAARGLQALIRHPRTPESATRGVAERIWGPVGASGVFVHREDFLMDGGVEKTRWSVVAGLDVRASPLRPVTSSPRDTVELTVSHLRAAGVDPGGITVLYRDEMQAIEKLVEARERTPPLVMLQGSRGERHHVWLLPPDEGEQILRLLESCRSSLVGDLVLYRAVTRLMDQPGFSRLSRPIVNLYNQRDFGVTLASTALVYAPFDGFDLNRFIASLHTLYEVVEYRAQESTPDDPWCEFFHAIRTEGITQRVAGIVAHGVPTAFLVKVPDGALPPGFASDVPEPALEYDVEWVERGLVQRLLPEGVAPVQVLTEPRQAHESLAAAGGGLAIILNPPPKRHIPDLADVGWRLPFGTLQLKPPVARGLFLAPLVPAGKRQREAQR